jgi:transcriptional regulator with XRE-family HTH domain
MEFDRAGFDRDVGLRLQRTRKERGITQAELAKRLGLPRPSYDGNRADRINRLHALAQPVRGFRQLERTCGFAICHK